jgi:mannose/fructose/N-acetylgalactosamine-specific phosphotransferase system component IIC
VEVVWVALAGAVVYLDTTAVAQFMISQPLIACPIWGLLVGRPEIGIFFGVAFQLIWLGSLPIGAAKFPEGNVGALVATALAVRVAPAANGLPAWITLLTATVVGILTAHAGSDVTPLVRRFLVKYCDRVVATAQSGRRAAFTWLFAGAVGVHFLAGFLLTLLAFIAGRWILSLYLGDFATGGVSTAIVTRTDSLLSGLWPGLLGAGVAVVIGRFVKRSSYAWFAGAAALGAAAGWLWL